MDETCEILELPDIEAMPEVQRARPEREIETQGLPSGGVRVLGRDGPTSGAGGEGR
jgi:hypothetical protein